MKNLEKEKKKAEFKIPKRIEFFLPRAKKQNLVLTTANSSVYKINLLLKTTGELFKLTFRSIGLPIRTTDEVRMTRAVDVTYALVLVMNSFAYSSKLTIQVLA